MRALIEHALEPDSPFEVVLVASDKPDALGLTLARELKVPTRVLLPSHYPERIAYDHALGALIQEYSPDLIVLAGFMRILSADFVRAFEGRILNIHPSLLPKFPGLHTHRRVLVAQEKEHGATVHFVTTELDAGAAIIQSRIPVNADDDERSLAARVQATEHRLYPLAVQWYAEGRLRYINQQARLDGKVLGGPLQCAQP